MGLVGFVGGCYLVVRCLLTIVFKGFDGVFAGGFDGGIDAK